MNFLSFNETTGFAETVFDAKPNARVLDSMKKLGWRWNPRGKCWYLHSPKTFEIVNGQFHHIKDGEKQALDYVAGVIGAPSDRVPAVLYDMQQARDGAGVRGMEDALGING